ncbi:hypothetical protein KY336_04690, partial [Candidatus Woesearchaeota archaeon]|nr:hypothetical protein [Candidatus Woesearchaeota archaeon]
EPEAGVPTTPPAAEPEKPEPTTPTFPPTGKRFAAPTPPKAEPEKPMPTPTLPGAEDEQPIPDGSGVGSPTTKTPGVPDSGTVPGEPGKWELLKPFKLRMPFSIFFTVDGYTTSYPLSFSYTAGDGCEVLDTTISTNYDENGNLIVSTETEVLDSATGETFTVSDPITIGVKPAIDVKPYKVGEYGGETSLVKSAVAQQGRSSFMQSILR